MERERMISIHISKGEKSWVQDPQKSCSQIVFHLLFVGMEEIVVVVGGFVHDHLLDEGSIQHGQVVEEVVQTNQVLIRSGGEVKEGLHQLQTKQRWRTRGSG